MDPHDPGLPPARRAGMGCVAKGCLTLAVVAILLIAVTGYLSYRGVQMVRGYLSDHPANVRVYPATDEQYQAVQQKLAPFVTGLENNQRASVELTADDLNTLVARDPNFADLRGRAAFSLARERLVADLSVPLNVGRTGERSQIYFNGRFETGLLVDDGVVSLQPRAISVNGASVPRWLMDLLQKPEAMKGFDQAFNDNVNQEPKVRDVLRHLRTLRIEGDRLVLTSTGEPAVAAPPPAR